MLHQINKMVQPKPLEFGAVKEFYRDTLGELRVQGNDIEGYHKMIFPYLSVKQVSQLMGIGMIRATQFCEYAVTYGFSQRYYDDDKVYYLFQ